MHKIAWYLLIALWLGLSGPTSAAFQRPANDCGQRLQQKFYPIARRYRQLVQQQIDLPPLEPSGPCPRESQTSGRLVPRSAALSTDAAFPLLMRLQV